MASSWNPDLSRYGPDALGLTLAELRRALAGGRVALKARLLDQAHIAGVGNLIADEVLWRAGLSPVRLAGEMSAPAVKRLHTHLTSGLAELIERGGLTWVTSCRTAVRAGSAREMGRRSGGIRWAVGLPGGARSTSGE